MQRVCTSFFLFLLIFFYHFHFCDAQCVATPPSGLKVTDVTACSATLKWKSIPNISFYKVRYKEGTGQWSTPVSVGTDTSYNFSALNAAVKYSFSVSSFCPASKSLWSTIKATTKNCSVPIVQNVETVNDSTVTISWEGCPSSYNKIRYRLASAGTWTNISTGTVSSVTLTGLVVNTNYVYQVKSCQTNTAWTAMDTFLIKPAVRPNILMIVLDDARWNSFSPTGGPSFYNSANISRIADEGVNFKNYCAVFSYCTPGRATMLTGLYPHKHGAENNSDSLSWSIPTVGSILHDAGYRSGMMGKLWGAKKPLPGYDYWLKAQPGYFPMYQYFDFANKYIAGHNTNVLTDSALKFISADTGQPFFLFIGYYAPHEPFTPQSQYLNRYINDSIPVPDNWRPFTENYPSYLDHLPPIWYTDSVKTDSMMEHYYETLAGADSAIGLLLDRLDSLNMLDNTMVIFTSDNGRIIGEHGLFMKLIGYDPSMRIPLIIRYPKWFSPHSEIDDQIDLNVDLAPTVLEAAGVTGNYHFDGKSLHHVADSSLRTDMMYEFISKDEVVVLPDQRAVRSMQYKYIYSGCADTTEEFFDLQNDPEENMNLIHDPNYSSLVNTYRQRLIELRESYADTLTLTELNCYLANPQFQKLLGEPEAQSILPDNHFSIYPNPASNQFSIIAYSKENSGQHEFQIYDLNGRLMLEEEFNDPNSLLTKEVSVPSSWSDGFYLIKWSHDGKTSVQKFCVNRNQKTNNNDGD